MLTNAAQPYFMLLGAGAGIPASSTEESMPSGKKKSRLCGSAGQRLPRRPLECSEHRQRRAAASGVGAARSAEARAFKNAPDAHIWIVIRRSCYVGEEPAAARKDGEAALPLAPWQVQALTRAAFFSTAPAVVCRYQARNPVQDCLASSLGAAPDVHEITPSAQ